MVQTADVFTGRETLLPKPMMRLSIATASHVAADASILTAVNGLVEIMAQVGQDEIEPLRTEQRSSSPVTIARSLAAADSASV